MIRVRNTVIIKPLNVIEMLQAIFWSNKMYIPWTKQSKAKQKRFAFFIPYTFGAISNVGAYLMWIDVLLQFFPLHFILLEFSSWFGCRDSRDLNFVLLFQSFCVYLPSISRFPRNDNICWWCGGKLTQHMHKLLYNVKCTEFAVNIASASERAREKSNEKWLCAFQ